MSSPTRREFNLLARRVDELELKLQSIGKKEFEPETDSIPDIEEVVGFRVIDQKITDLLVGAGFTSKKLVSAASDEALLAISGIGPRVLEKIRAAVEE